jgi:glyceraldehyde-3-phosphate dehydrogenase (NAD(P))
MHTLSAHFTLKEAVSRENIMDTIYNTPELALTHKTAVNQVFSFGRDHGHFGRILNQAVFVEPSIKVNKNHLYFWSFTPQDGNAILSSVKAIMYWLNDKNEVDNLMNNAKPWLFNEV